MLFQVNHIPNCGHFTNKLGLLLCLRQYEMYNRELGSKQQAGTLRLQNIIPETYWIDDAGERYAFYNRFRGEPSSQAFLTFLM